MQIWQSPRNVTTREDYYEDNLGAQLESNEQTTRASGRANMFKETLELKATIREWRALL